MCQGDTSTVPAGSCARRGSRSTPRGFGETQSHRFNPPPVPCDGWPVLGKGCCAAGERTQWVQETSAAGEPWGGSGRRCVAKPGCPGPFASGWQV